ncbi:MAG: hypothetical protein JSR80_01825 [Verrucomicrobia bacterium]|nr:hypothetical protein [Verrucomicrobiota bacterium]
MKVDIMEMTSFFDELDPYNDDEKKVYGFRSFRSDYLTIKLGISVYESKVAISIYKDLKISLASFYLNGCLEINVLDEACKCLEIIHEIKNERCILSLYGSPILQYQD